MAANIRRNMKESIDDLVYQCEYAGETVQEDIKFEAGHLMNEFDACQTHYGGNNDADNLRDIDNRLMEVIPEDID